MSRPMRRSDCNLSLINKKKFDQIIFLLQTTLDYTDLADLQSELRILIHVGENENIVNLLGACTKGNIYIKQNVFLQNH